MKFLPAALASSHQLPVASASAMRCACILRWSCCWSDSSEPRYSRAVPNPCDAALSAPNTLVTDCTSPSAPLPTDKPVSATSRRKPGSSGSTSRVDREYGLDGSSAPYLSHGPFLCFELYLSHGPAMYSPYAEMRLRVNSIRGYLVFAFCQATHSGLSTRVRDPGLVINLAGSGVQSGLSTRVRDPGLVVYFDG